MKMSESAKAYEDVGFVSGIKAFRTASLARRGVVYKMRFPVVEVTVASTHGHEFRFLCERDAVPNLGEKVKCTISFELVGDDDDTDAA